MKTKKYIFLALLFILSSALAFSQDIHYTLFTQSPLTVSPAQAGTSAWIRGLINYRNQWKSITTPYTTFSASFDQKIKKHWKRVSPKTRTLLFKSSTEQGLGWGINFYNDRAGDGHMGTLQGNLSLAYQVLMNKENMLAAGLQVGFIQRSIYSSDLYWESQYDPNSPTFFNSGMNSQENFPRQSFIRSDAGCGVLYSYKKNERYMRGNDQRDLQVGVSVLHLNKPRYSFVGTDERLAPRLMIHAQGIYGISNTNFALAPGILFAKQGPNKEFLIGTLVRYMLREDSKYTGYVKGAAFSLGGYYRSKDAIVAAGLFEFSTYAVGLSYDFNISNLKTVSNGRGGLEVVIRFLNPAPFLFSRASFNK